MKTGLVSISFRQLSPGRIVDLVVEAGLEGIEWGGDVHVPHGDVAQAARVAQWTLDAGLEVACYGSYLRLGDDSGKSPGHSEVLDSAAALGAPLIRVWPGAKGSAYAEHAYYDRVASEALALAEAAAKLGIGVAFEYHGGTLTDTQESAVRLLEKTVHPGVFTLWQPTNGASVEVCEQSLESVLGRLANLHVFHWVKQEDGGMARLPLEQGEAAWMRYLALAGNVPAYALLEFVAGDSEAQFLADAAVLKRWGG